MIQLPLIKRKYVRAGKKSLHFVNKQFWSQMRKYTAVQISETGLYLYCILQKKKESPLP